MVDVAEKRVFLNCPDEYHLPRIAQKIIDFAADIRILLFEGDLGAGKTTLIKEICAALQVVDNVSSPSFSIINQYERRSGESVYHFDFYRIKSIGEAQDIGSEEYLNSENWCFIEWPSKVKGMIYQNYVQINIEGDPDGSRNLHVARYD